MVIVSCLRCGAKNRVDERAASMQPVCGRCGAKLPVPAGQDETGPLVVTDASFPERVLNAGDRPVLVDCWAPWCGPCRMLGPTIDQLAAESAGRYIIAKLNTEIHQQTAARYRIEAIPSLLIFRNGQLVDRLMGVQPKPVIEQRLSQA